jgi:hypothetical protein
MRRVGLLFPDPSVGCLSTALAVGLAEGVEKVLAEQNIHLNVLTLCPDGSLPQAVTRGELDGLIVRAGAAYTADNERLMRGIQAASLPTVWAFGGRSIPADSDAVLVDNRGCGEWAAARVLELGCRDVCLVKPVLRNLEIEFRAVAFDFHLAENGIKPEIFTFANCDDIKRFTRERLHSGVAVFVPGHDVDVRVVHEQLSAGAGGNGGRDPCHLLAVLTEEAPLLPHLGESLHVLHIDPLHVGMAAARQVLARREQPWAPPARVLVPAKELQEPAKMKIEAAGVTRSAQIGQD